MKNRQTRKRPHKGLLISRLLNAVKRPTNSRVSVIKLLENGIKFVSFVKGVEELVDHLLRKR